MAVITLAVKVLDPWDSDSSNMSHGAKLQARLHFSTHGVKDESRNKDRTFRWHWTFCQVGYGISTHMDVTQELKKNKTQTVCDRNTTIPGLTEAGNIVNAGKRGEGASDFLTRLPK